MVDVHRAGPSAAGGSCVSNVCHYTKVTGGIADDEADEDYVVLITADRLGDRFGWMGVRTYDSTWDRKPLWYNIGYPGDLPKGGESTYPIWQRGSGSTRTPLIWGVVAR